MKGSSEDYSPTLAHGQAFKTMGHQPTANSSSRIFEGKQMLQPGRVFIDNRKLMVSVQNGSIHVKRLQLQNKKPMSDFELLNGYEMNDQVIFRKSIKKLYIVSMNTNLSNGKLLVADPSIIGDFSFTRAVILLADHNNEGSVGFILTSQWRMI
ncbi:MAG: hypothetical protein CM15mP32_0840 [Flavobacteriaceae bacterium]|nr:MAG: hypothetical protein CM15mP32_0840 [Flavobacteriaceae bacterium]